METSVVAAARAADRLELRLFGDVELRRGGVVLPLPPSRRTRALLGYLVATGAPHLRSALCDLLWEGPDDPRASLRWSLTKLRPLLDDARRTRLQADRDRVAFDSRDCDVDAQRVLVLLAGGVEAAALPALDEAARLLRGEFLEGLDLSACYRFHHWCMAERERYGGLRRDVLQALVRRLEAQPERALQHGRTLVGADPLSESAHATLVRLLAAAGRYPEAERQYEWARELLRREIALAPGGALDDAIRAVRHAQRKGAAAAPASAAPERAVGRDDAGAEPPAAARAADDARAGPRAAARTELIGRAAECAAIVRWLEPSGPASMLLFAGEPGIGKTTLLSRAADEAEARGRRVLRGRCFEAEAVRPYGVWLDALRATPPSTGATDAAPLLERGVGAETREALFEGLATWMRGLASRQPLTVLLDDVQWIDEASAALLHFLLRTLATAAPVGFAVAARTAEIDDNPAALTLLQSVQRERLLQRLDLAPLDLGQSLALLGASDAAALELAREAGGNPLYLLELSRAGVPGPPDAMDAGRGIEALVEDRLRALEPPVRDLLGWAAAMGGAVQPEWLAASTGAPVTDVLSRLAQLERRGLLLPGADGSFDFVHGVLRQAVYRGLSQPLRRAVHRQIALALAAAADREPRLHADVVHHASLAGDAATMVRACLAAGEQALRVFANTQAAQLAERGLGQVGRLPAGAERVRLEIGLLRLRIAAAAGPGSGRLPDLSERIEASVRAAEALALHREAAAGWEILAYWRQHARNAADVRDATLEAERWARHADDITRCRQLANSGRCLIDIEADPVQGLALLDEAEALAGRLGVAVMELAWGRGLAARRHGESAAAIAALDRAIALAQQGDNQWREYECRVWRATLAWEQGCWADVVQLAEPIVAAAAKMGETGAPFAQALAALARSRLGEPAAGDELARQLAALRDRDDKAHLAYALNEASALALQAGDRERAERLAGEALAAARAVRRPTEVAVALARLASAAGSAAQAATWLDQAPARELVAARAAAALEAARQAVSTLDPTRPA